MSNFFAPDPYFSEHIATFGDRLCAAREDSNLTQKQLADKLGVTLRTVQSWENDVNAPRANKLQMVSALLNVSIIWLMSGLGSGVDPPDEKHLNDHNKSNDIVVELNNLRKMGQKLVLQIESLERKITERQKSI